MSHNDRLLFVLLALLCTSMKPVEPLPAVARSSIGTVSVGWSTSTGCLFMSPARDEYERAGLYCDIGRIVDLDAIPAH